MSVIRYYPADTDLARAKAIYELVEWASEDPDRAVEAGATIVGVGLFIYALGRIARVLSE